MTLDQFSDLTLSEMEDHLLSISRLCIDGAPKSLARKIEIYIHRVQETV